MVDRSAVPAGKRAGRPVLFARLIKVEHSVYALPFAYAGALLADLALPSWQTLVWITVAMVAGRSAAMALNRLIDAELDARNPRTASRELPAGRLRRGEVVAFTVASLGVLVVAAFNLSPPCRYLWPIVVAAFVLYPYAKRFTWLCHYALGLTDGLAPAAAWIAVSGSLALAPVLLFFAVGLWVGGFDAVYGCFDVEFDRREGIHSIAARFGEAAGARRPRLARRRHRPARVGRDLPGAAGRLLRRHGRRGGAAAVVLRRHGATWSLTRGDGVHDAQRSRRDRIPRGRCRGAPGPLAASGLWWLCMGATRYILASQILSLSLTGPARRGWAWGSGR